MLFLCSGSEDDVICLLVFLFRNRGSHDVVVELEKEDPKSLLCSARVTKCCGVAGMEFCCPCMLVFM